MTEEEITKMLRGIPANVIIQSMNGMHVGVDWRGCTKRVLCEALARDDHRIQSKISASCGDLAKWAARLRESAEADKQRKSALQKQLAEGDKARIQKLKERRWQLSWAQKTLLGGLREGERRCPAALGWNNALRFAAQILADEEHKVVYRLELLEATAKESK